MFAKHLLQPSITFDRTKLHSLASWWRTRRSLAKARVSERWTWNTSERYSAQTEPVAGGVYGMCLAFVWRRRW